MRAISGDSKTVQVDQYTEAHARIQKRAETIAKELGVSVDDVLSVANTKNIVAGYVAGGKASTRPAAAPAS